MVALYSKLLPLIYTSCIFHLILTSSSRSLAFTEFYSNIFSGKKKLYLLFIIMIVSYDRCDRACIYTMRFQLEIGMHSTVFSLSFHTWCGNGRKSLGISPALSCFHLSTVELFSPSNPKWFLEPVSRFEKNHSYIRYFS